MKRSVDKSLVVSTMYRFEIVCAAVPLNTSSYAIDTLDEFTILNFALIFVADVHVYETY